VLLLEIVSGKRNSGHGQHYGDFVNLLGHVSFYLNYHSQELTRACRTPRTMVTHFLRQFLTAYVSAESTNGKS
jgi:hypothetical protein